MGRGCCYADTRKICTADVTKEIRSSFPGAAVFCTPRSCLFHFTHSTLFIFDFFSSCGTAGSVLTCGFHVKNTLLWWGCEPEGVGAKYIYIYMTQEK